jgi:soluble lytic murein transglycosylase
VTPPRSDAPCTSRRRFHEAAARFFRNARGMTLRNMLPCLLVLLVACGGGGETSTTSAAAERAAAAWRSPADADRERGVAALRRGLELRRTGNVDGALAAFAEAAAVLPDMAGWAAVLSAEAEARGGDTARVAARLRGVDSDLVREVGWRARRDVRLAAGDTAAALAFLSAVQRPEDAPRAAELHLSRGTLMLARRDSAAARQALVEAMRAAPGSTSARQAATRAAALPARRDPLMMEAARVLLRAGDARGVAALEAALGQARLPAAEEVELRLQGSRALFGQRRYPEVRRLAAALPAAAPVEDRAEAALLTGRALLREGRRDAALESFRRAVRYHPRSAAATRALFILAEADHEDGRLASARQLYRDAALTGIHLPEAELAAVRLMGLDWITGDLRAAAGVLDDYVRLHPGAAGARIHYWLGRVHQRAGQEAPARQAYTRALEAEPLSFYGMRAAERLGSTLADLPLEPSPEPDAATLRLAAAPLFRVGVLHDVGLAEGVRLEVERFAGEAPDARTWRYLLAETHVTGGRPVQGMLLGREIQRAEGSWNERLLRIVFPFPHRELIEREARSRGLDPFMVAGLIRQESMFNPVAVSPAGAVGLMQLMPGTGAQLARGAGIQGYSTARLREPELNVRLGTIFLADLLRQHGGREMDAFAAYNAGPARLNAWRRYPERVDAELFAERIPFAETRDYVKILTFNRALYTILHGG